MSGNFLIRKIFKYENKLKIAVMTAMLGFCLFLTYYFNLVLQREVLFTHFFYIPIILATMWWKRKGLFAPFFLSIVLVSIHFYEFGTGNDIYNTILRASAFIIIGALIAYLREWIDKDAEQIKVSVNLLKESEEKFKSMVDCSDGLVTTINSLGIITFINNNAVKYGYKPKEIIGKSMTDFIHPDDIEFMLKIFENGIKTGKFVKSIILRFKKKDGTFFYGEHRAGVICKNGEVDSIIGHMYDIAERRDKEILLKESEEKFRSLFESSRDALMILAAPDWKFTSGNKAAIKLFNMKDEKGFVAGYPWEYSPKFQSDGQLSEDKAKKIIERVIKEGSYLFDWTHKRLSGDVFPAMVLLTCFKYNKKIFVQANIREVSEQKKMEAEKAKLQEQLLQSQKMEALGSFVGGIAHDFNNLLTPILSVSEFSGEALPGKKQLIDNFNEIKKSALRGKDLVSRLLTFSREQPIKSEILNLNDLILNIEKLLKPLIGENIELKCILDKKLGNVEVDPVQIEQIILNLAANARDAMANGGKFIIETLNMNITKDYADIHKDFEAGEYVLLSVSDSGAGMNKETVRQIFNPFFTTKEKDKGTGLGLSTVYGIVKQNGGNISVYSEIGKGTAFKIFLKKSKGKVVKVESKKILKDIKLLKGKETILLVEDDEDIMRVAKRILEQYGYKVFTALDAQGCKEIFKKHKDIQLLFTDIMLTGEMNGIQVAKELKAVKPKIKVLYMSGYSDGIISTDDISDKDINFIQKPFGYKELGQKIREVFDNK